MDWLDELLFTPWAWFVLALALAGLEIAAPGAFMIWLAAAALATGVLALLGIGWQLQLVAFASLAIASVVIGRNYLRRNPTRSADELLNRRGTRMLGEVVIVIEAIHDGEGRVQVDDSPWLACGPDMPVGARARIIGVEGSKLHVERG